MKVRTADTALLKSAFLITLTAVAIWLPLSAQPLPMAPVYEVVRLRQPLVIDSQWDKPAWKLVPALSVTHYMGRVPDFQPVVEAKMQYDTINLYVIFRVRDCYVRSLNRQIDSPVWSTRFR